MAKAATAVLELVEAKLEQVQKQKSAKMQELLKEHLDEREHLMLRRYELINGAEPKPEEMKGYSGPSPTHGGANSKVKGVPCFWLNALCADATIGPTVAPHDREALKALQDVRYVRGARGMVVELHFGDNAFFTNKVLRRGMAVERDEAGVIVDVREEATTIDWHDGHNLLVREVGGSRKKQKKGKKGKKERGGEEGDDDEGERRRRFKHAPSFFRFFTPFNAPKAKEYDPTADEDEEDHVVEDEEEEEEGHGAGASLRRDKDSHLLQAFIRSIVPRAAHLYEAAPALEDDEDDSAAHQGGGHEAEEEGYEVVGGGTSAAHGGVEALPARVQRALHAVKHVQAQIDAMCLKFKTAKWAVSRECDVEEQALLDQRAHALTHPLSTVRCKGGPPAVTTSIPLFWLRALRASETTTLAVARRDERALAALADVRLKWNWDKMPTRENPIRECTVEWHFLSNPYFGEGVLAKTYQFACSGGSSQRLDLTGPGTVVGEGPVWLPKGGEGGEGEGGKGGGRGATRDLTVRVVEGARKPKPARSFFNLFKKGHLHLVFGVGGGTGGDGGGAAAREALSLEEQMVGELMGGPLRMTPSALYAEVEVEEGDVGDEEHEEDEMDSEAEEDSEDEARGAAAAARRRAKRHAPHGQGVGALLAHYLQPSKNCVLLSLLVMVGLAQLLGILDMLFSKRRR